MGDDVPADALDLLEDHDAFATADDGAYEVTTTPFEATIAVEPAGDVDAGDAGPGDDVGLEGVDAADDAAESADEPPADDADPDAESAGDDASPGDDVAADEPDVDYEAVFDVTLVLPTLDSVVADDIVSNEVEDAWHSTLDLRLEDAYGVAEVDPVEDYEFEIAGTEIRASYRFAAPDARNGVNDAKVIVDFAEGTYLQGVIPGYEYEDPVAGMLQRATDTAQGSSDGAERGGTPM